MVSDNILEYFLFIYLVFFLFFLDISVRKLEVLIIECYILVLYFLFV